MATFKLKNDQKDSGTVPGIGAYVNGVLLNAPDNFENPNFEKVMNTQPVHDTRTPVQPIAPAAPAVSVTPDTTPQESILVNQAQEGVK